MTTHAIAVIGANYGDEGKGLMVDYYSNLHLNNKPIVVRSNGGAQAGHTVELASGECHVFSHFGSGSFLGVPTLLSQFFITNPRYFIMELDELNAKGVTPDVYVDTRALVTTPFDIMLNQALETKRGGDRHGSVGMGIGTTVERHDTIPLSFADLEIWSTQELSNVLHIIGARTRRQMINNNVDSHYINMVDDHIIERIIYDFISDITFMLNKVTTVCTPEFLPDYNTVIFEAGQGLLLDIEYGMFPYVTHSHCGARNIHTILDEINFKGELQLNYITRTYLTRHGAGPLESEVRWDVGLEDKTNKTNEFQGSLRFAPLDIASLMCRVTDDAIYCEQQSYSCTTRINVTCMDQDHDLFSNKDPELNPRQPFIDIGSTWSYGPTRQDVRI